MTRPNVGVVRIVGFANMLFRRVPVPPVAVLLVIGFALLATTSAATCSPPVSEREHLDAIEDARDEVEELKQDGETDDEIKSAAEILDRRITDATAAAKLVDASAKAGAEVIETRVTQDDLIDIADTALAAGEIDLDQFIETAEAIKGIGAETEGDTDTSKDPPSDSDPEKLPAADPNEPPVVEDPPEPAAPPEPRPTPTPEKATKYNSVGVYRTESWITGDPAPDASPKDGSKIDIGLGFIDMYFVKSVIDVPGYEWTIEFSFGSPYADQFPGRTIRLTGRGKATGGGAIPEGLNPLDMYFITDLPEGSVEILETTDPLEIAYGATSKLEVAVTIPKGDLGDRFMMGWGVRGCGEECEYYWTYEGQEN